VSEWRYLSRRDLKEFGSYKENRGWLMGVTAAWAGFAFADRDVVLFILALIALAVYWLYGYRYEDRFTRIRKTIDDAGGGA